MSCERFCLVTSRGVASPYTLTCACFRENTPPNMPGLPKTSLPCTANIGSLWRVKKRRCKHKILLSRMEKFICSTPTAMCHSVSINNMATCTKRKLCSALPFWAMRYVLLRCLTPRRWIFKDTTSSDGSPNKSVLGLTYDGTRRSKLPHTCTTVVPMLS